MNRFEFAELFAAFWRLEIGFEFALLYKSGFEDEKVDDHNKDFWNALDELVNASEIVIDRPKGSAHPKFPNFIYRVDYGSYEPIRTSFRSAFRLKIILSSNRSRTR